VSNNVRRWTPLGELPALPRLLAGEKGARFPSPVILPLLSASIFWLNPPLPTPSLGCAYDVFIFLRGTNSQNIVIDFLLLMYVVYE